MSNNAVITDMATSQPGWQLEVTINSVPVYPWNNNFTPSFHAGIPVPPGATIGFRVWNFNHTEPLSVMVSGYEF